MEVEDALLDAADAEIREIRISVAYDPITGHGRYRYVEALEDAIRSHYGVHYRQARRIDELEDAEEPTPLYWVGYVIASMVGLVVLAGLAVVLDLLVRALVS